ncbi:mitogen-activated protein kinase kinase kinase 5 isoform X2 [Diospyros lotus]|uniref:mitogen-activated protein kinase kinase kinase 5 isoform X2 n=1 Tax=Diospyros lotus TaxID=55363 RepID=UPI002259AE54|nr:mitogen-activated protein kinase kinase kinase 5 isoform X2 [Diospyros lotus]
MGFPFGVENSCCRRKQKRVTASQKTDEEEEEAAAGGDEKRLFLRDFSEISKFSPRLASFPFQSNSLCLLIPSLLRRLCAPPPPPFPPKYRFPMRWWQTPFTSSSSSSPSSSRQHSDDGGLHKFFSFTARRSSRPRRLTRSRQFRRLGDRDVVVGGFPPSFWLSPTSHVDSPSRSPSIPQPLPLPELALLLRRDAAGAASGNVPLPSPKEFVVKSGEERGRTDGLTGDQNGNGGTPGSGLGSTFAYHDLWKNKEQAETPRSSKAPQELNGIKRFREKYSINVPLSSPTSPYSSPAFSCRRKSGDVLTSHHTAPQTFEMWSAPEMAPYDTNLGLGFSYQLSPKKTAFSVGSSPLHSPRLSPSRGTKSPNGPSSPTAKRPSIEIPVAWRDSNHNTQGNGHPLPLPPGFNIPVHPTSAPQVTAKPDLMPKKSQWQKGKLIGRGTFGSVYVATNRETGALCAMKEVELLPDDPKSAESIKQLEQEIKVLSHLKHPNIVQYYGSEIIEDRFYIYLEYVHPGSINKYVREHCGAITESVVRNFTRHILSGLSYLHNTKTIHRDIKGANLLVDANGVVKLADFGMAKHLAGPASTLSLKGSPYWMAPELLQSVMQKDASPDLALAVDIWSLGCTIIEMLNGKPPWSEYEGAAAMFKVLRETPPIPEMLSAEGKDFLRRCFCRNPAQRPTANKLLEHPFLKNSQHLDVPSCIQSLNGMKLTDKAESLKERSFRTLEHLVVSPRSLKLEHSGLRFEPLLMSPDAQNGGRKQANNFIHASFSPVRLANDLSAKLQS